MASRGAVNAQTYPHSIKSRRGPQGASVGPVVLGRAMTDGAPDLAAPSPGPGSTQLSHWVRKIGDGHSPDRAQVAIRPRMCTKMIAHRRQNRGEFAPDDIFGPLIQWGNLGGRCRNSTQIRGAYVLRVSSRVFSKNPDTFRPVSATPFPAKSGRRQSLARPFGLAERLPVVIRVGAPTPRGTENRRERGDLERGSPPRASSWRKRPRFCRYFRDPRTPRVSD